MAAICLDCGGGNCRDQRRQAQSLSGARRHNCLSGGSHHDADSVFFVVHIGPEVLQAPADSAVVPQAMQAPIAPPVSLLFTLVLFIIAMVLSLLLAIIRREYISSFLRLCFALPFMCIFFQIITRLGGLDMR